MCIRDRLLVCVLSACAPAPPPTPKMSDIMAQCDATTPFDAYVGCIKQNTRLYARVPSDQVGLLNSFFAQLDALNEEVARHKITYVEAKAAAYRAWGSAHNAVQMNRPVTCIDMGGGVTQCR